jgi:hypothetical protein
MTALRHRLEQLRLWLAGQLYLLACWLMREPIRTPLEYRQEIESAESDTREWQMRYQRLLREYLVGRRPPQTVEF